MKSIFYPLFVAAAFFLSCNKGAVSSHAISISGFSPLQEGPGATVILHGSGFGNSTSTTTVFFGSVSASIITIADTMLTVYIPTGAVTGNITVKSPNGTAISPQAFTVLTGTWQQVNSLPGPGRTAAYAFAANNMGYVGGGASANSSADFLNDLFAFDPQSNSWAQKASMPFAGLLGVTAITFNNKAYLIGGLNDSASQQREYAEVFEYDPVADSWTRMNDFAGIARTDACGFAINGNIYFGTGYSDNAPGYVNGRLTDWWQYTPATDTWARMADFPGDATFSAAAFAINGKGFVGMGFGDMYESYPSDFYQYDPALNVWTGRANFPGDVTNYVNNNIPYTAFGIGSYGYVTGTTSWQFDPATDQWTQKTRHPVEVLNGVAFVIGNTAFVGTGVTPTSNFSQQFWQFNP